MESQRITLGNINAVRYQIAQKLDYNKPFYATREDTASVITDQDTFPYPRYFRGEYNNNAPVVMEREAGYRPRQDRCYRITPQTRKIPTNYCWEYACSTVTPCVPRQQPQGKPCTPEKNDNYIIPP